MFTAGTAVEYGTARRDNVAAFIDATLHEPVLSRVIVELTDGSPPVGTAAAILASFTMRRQGTPPTRRLPGTSAANVGVHFRLQAEVNASVRSVRKAFRLCSRQAILIIPFCVARIPGRSPPLRRDGHTHRKPSPTPP